MTMLDAMQNTILNKTDSTNKRANSPSAEVSKLESKFEDMFAKAAQAKTAKNTESAQKAQNKAKLAEQDSKIPTKNAKATQGKNISSMPNTQSQLAIGKEANAKSAPLTSFDFADNDGQDSKIALQEKIKNAKESKPAEVNPLIEALSAANKESQKTLKADSQPGAEHDKNIQNLVKPAIDKTITGQNEQKLAEQKSPAERLTTMPMPQKVNDEKTLADIERLAQVKGLNPSNIILSKEEEKPATPKVKTIPASAKESIAYEHENNVDRIAIVKRGTNKPKNITSKISNEYASKKPETENIADLSFIKDRPQIS